jgi:hypothetical protein
MVLAVQADTATACSMCVLGARSRQFDSAVAPQNLIGSDWWVVLIVCGQAAFMAMPIRRGLPVAFFIRWGHFAVSTEDRCDTHGGWPVSRGEGLAN